MAAELAASAALAAWVAWAYSSAVLPFAASAAYLCLAAFRKESERQRAARNGFRNGSHIWMALLLSTVI